MDEWNGAGHMGGMWLWWIVGIAIVAVAFWVMVRTSFRTGGGGGVSAEESLKRRYAKGEIDKDTYEKRLHDLRQ